MVSSKLGGDGSACEVLVLVELGGPVLEEVCHFSLSFLAVGDVDILEPLSSVLSTFYYGNLTYPSRGPPKLGFLSTVPPDADVG